MRLRRTKCVPLPEPVTFGLVQLPDVKLWRRNREAVAVGFQYVVECGPDVELPPEVEWFVREFASAIWSTDGGQIGRDSLDAIQMALQVTAMTGVAFAELDDNNGAGWPPGTSLPSVLTALDFGVVIMTDGYPRPLIAAGCYTMRVAHYLCRSPDARAEELIPAPLKTGTYLNDEAYAITAADIVRTLYREGH